MGVTFTSTTKQKSNVVSRCHSTSASTKAMKHAWFMVRFSRLPNLMSKTTLEIVLPKSWYFSRVFIFRERYNSRKLNSQKFSLQYIFVLRSLKSRNLSPAKIYSVKFLHRENYRPYGMCKCCLNLISAYKQCSLPPQ